MGFHPQFVEDLLAKLDEDIVKRDFREVEVEFRPQNQTEPAGGTVACLHDDGYDRFVQFVGIFRL